MGTYGRAGIYMMQEYCRLIGVRPTEGELQDLGARAIGALSDTSDRQRCEAGQGFPPARRACRGAAPSYEDRAFAARARSSMPWLERCGVIFGRWFEQAPYLPQCGAIAGMPHAARLRALAPPSQHAAVELLRGTMTRHNFIAYRDDYVGETRPIAFEGDAWRKYVPVRLPWTLTVRERLPRRRRGANQSGACLSRSRAADRLGGGADLDGDRRQAFCG